MSYKCTEVPEPDFDAAFTDEMVVTAYQEEDDFNPSMPDEYPNVRLRQLESNIQETSLTAAEAFETASNASSIAAQSAQAAQEATEIAEGATTAAGEAVQAIGEHVAGKTNPHATDVTQEFAEVKVTALKSVTSGGEIADVDYNWFKSVYSDLVDSSVKSWIKGVVTFLKSLTDRVTRLEDDYILRYVVPQDSALIELTLDKYGNAISIGEGKKLIIDVYCQFATADTLLMRINNATGSNYYRGIDAVTALFLSGARVNIYSHLDLGVVNGNLIGSVQNSSYTTSSRQALTYQLRTLDIPLPVTSIQLFGATGISILANSVIILKIK